MYIALVIKQVLLFWIGCLCLCNTYAQSTLSFEVNSIFPRHLIETEPKSDAAFDKQGFLWNCSANGLQCFDGEIVISYNNNYETDQLVVTQKGNGYVGGTMIDQRYYWAIERKTYELICFDTETRALVKRLAPPDGKIYYIIEKDEHDNLFALCTTREHTDNRIYRIHNMDTTDQIYIANPSKFKSYAIYNGDHWIRFQESVGVYDRSGKLKKSLSTQEASCKYFSDGPRDRLVMYNACVTEFFEYDSNLDSLMNVAIPDELTNNQHNIFHFGDQIWFIGQHSSIQLWDRTKNKVEDYSKELVRQYQENENAIPVQKIHQILSDGEEGYYLISMEIIMHVTPRKKTAKDYEIPIEIDQPFLSMRATAEDDLGNIYTSFYTGVAVKEKGADSFVDFRNTSTAPKVKEATYSLSTWKNKLIWNNIIFDLSSNKEGYIDTPDYGIHLNHNLQGDTLWTYMWLSNKLIKTDLVTEESEVVKDKVFPHPTWASSFLFDENKNVFWISTGKNGIMSFDKNGEVRSHYDLKEMSADPNLYVYEMLVQDSLIWYGTQKNLVSLNLNSNELKSFESNFTKSNGERFPRSIFTILPKNDSIFYLGTNQGLVKFNTQSNNMNALKGDHGLAKLEFNRNSTFQSSDGTYYFGTVDGLYAFRDEELDFEVDEIYESPTIYRIKIASNYSQEEKVITTHISNNYDLILEPDESFVTFDLSTPSFGRKASYGYQFTNVQQQWIAGNQSIVIPSLEPGSHVLRIKNALESEDANSFIQINITKKQFWYKKYWVLGLFVLLVIGLVAFLQRWIFAQKIQREKELARLRTRISSDLHDDVGSILSGLAMQSEMLKYQIKGDSQNELNEISTMSRDAMERMRDTVWSIDSRKDKYENLIDRMRSFAEKSLERKGIDHSFVVENINGKKSIFPTLRQNVYLIFKEAITNIVKHSNATFVEVRFYQEGKSIHLRIKDNGNSDVLLDSTKVSDGLGLSNMKLRTKNINGRLILNNEKGFGVWLSFEE